MTYSLTLITNRADCQTVIDLANNKKQVLEYQKMGLAIDGSNAGTNNVNFEAELASATAEAAALQTVLAALPEGPVKDETTVKFMKADLRRATLQLRKNTNGSISILEREHDVACIEQSMAQTDAYIQALTTRLAELPAA